MIHLHIWHVKWYLHRPKMRSSFTAWPRSNSEDDAATSGEVFSPLDFESRCSHRESLLNNTTFWNAPSPLYFKLILTLILNDSPKRDVFPHFCLSQVDLSGRQCLGSRSLSKAFPLFYLWSLSNSYPSFLLEIPSHFISVTWQLNGLILINQTKGYSL